MSPGLHAVILAAGAGRRLGQPKAALRLRGKWMLPGIVRALRGGGAESVTLVLSAAAEQAIAGLGPHGADRVAINPAPERGRTASLWCGLEALEAAAGVAAVLVHPCDVPLLSRAAVLRLISAWRRAPGRELLAARPVTPAGRGGHPLLLGAARLADLRALAADQSLRDLLHRQPQHLLDVVIAGDPGPFYDVDTPEQLQFLESLL